MDYIHRPPWVSGEADSLLSLPTLRSPHGYITFRMESGNSSDPALLADRAEPVAGRGII